MIHEIHINSVLAFIPNKLDETRFSFLEKNDISRCKASVIQYGAIYLATCVAMVLRDKLQVRYSI